MAKQPDLFIGIDPGINGAIAVIDIKNDTVELFEVPTFKVNAPTKANKNRKKSEYDKLGMAALFKPYARRNVSITMEQVHAMPGQGVTSMFNFGRGVGLWEGVIAGFGWEPNFVTPQTWKKEYGDRLFKSIKKPDILKMSKNDYNRASLADRKKFDVAKKTFEAEKKSEKNAAKDRARDLVIELYPNLESMLKRKKDSDKAEALLIAETKRREIYG